MKKLFLLLIILLVFSQLVAAGSLKPDLSEIISKIPETENVSVIILFHEAPRPADISVIKSDGASIKHKYALIDAVAVTIPAQAAEKIAKRPFVKLVEPDYKVKLVLDTSASQIQADKVWNKDLTGKDIDVAILDTGIHDEHPALTVEKEVDYTDEGTDDLHGHGTHVAGIVASIDSTYRGISYDADLFNVKVLNKDGWGRGSDVIKGIEWAVDNGAEIISMSLGAKIDPCDGTDALSRAVDKAVSKGVVVVVAAGNSGPDAGTITSPGCSKKGITIGAVNDNDNVPSWSSRGPTDDGRVKPDLVAPGVGISSTWKDNSFKSLSGTSMSTPHVSGVAALLLETDSSLKPEDVKNILKSTALDLGLDENTQGAGRVDAYEAYIYIANVSKEPENETEIDNKTCDWLPRGLRKKELLPPSWQEKCPEAGLTPDSLFYGVEKSLEKLNLFFIFNKVKKAEKHLRYAEERLAEAGEMIEKERLEFVGDLIEEYGENLEKGNEISEIAQGLGENVTKVRELVAVATSIHIDVLKEILEKVPEQAKASIQRAINSSKRGNEEALNALEKIKPEKAAEIHFKIAERKLNRAREKAEEGKMEEVGELIEEYQERINKSAQITKIAKGLGKNTTAVEQIIAEATSRHLEILSEVHDKVPKQAKPAIEKAIDASANGREKAVKALKEKDSLDDIPEQASVSEKVREKISSIQRSSGGGQGDSGFGSSGNSKASKMSKGARKRQD